MAARIPPLNSLKVLEAAARLLSFKKASQELHVTPAAVSHQLAHLESQLGVTLFKRVNQGIELTAPGRMCLPKLQEGLECLREAVEQIHAHAQTNTITVTAAPSFAMFWLMPRLHRFILAHPDLDVHVVTQLGAHFGSQRARMVDSDASLWAAASDVALIYGKGHYPELEVEKLLPLTVTPLCSPRLLTGEHPLTAPGDLRRHTLLHDDRGVHAENKPYWRVWSNAMHLENFNADAGPRFTHALLALNAAAEGFGVVASTPQLAAAHLAAGTLVAPFDVEVPLDSSYFIASAKPAYNRCDVAKFRAWLHAEAAAA